MNYFRVNVERHHPNKFDDKASYYYATFPKSLEIKRSHEIREDSDFLLAVNREDMKQLVELYPLNDEQVAKCNTDANEIIAKIDYENHYGTVFTAGLIAGFKKHLLTKERKKYYF